MSGSHVGVCPLWPWLGQCHSLWLPLMIHQLRVCSSKRWVPWTLQGQKSRYQDLPGVHLITLGASAKAECPLSLCQASLSSPHLRAGEQAGGLLPAFISSSVSGNQTRGEPGAGASPYLRSQACLGDVGSPHQGTTACRILAGG